jgi:hypothetical protein
MARKPNAAPPQLDLGDDLGNSDDTGITIENEADANLADANGHDKDESTISMEEQLEALRRRAENAEAEAANLRQHTAKQGEDLQTTRVAAAPALLAHPAAIHGCPLIGVMKPNANPTIAAAMSLYQKADRGHKGAKRELSMLPPTLVGAAKTRLYDAWMARKRRK